MSDYKRFISYIYEYVQGEKKESLGFVKVNARDGVCKIQIHMRGFYTRGQKPHEAYIFIQKRERLSGQPLGELQNTNGALEWNGVTETDNLMKSGFSLEESQGIYIEGEDHIYAAQWNDFPVDVERFEPLRRSVRQAVGGAPEGTASKEERESEEGLKAAQIMADAPDAFDRKRQSRKQCREKEQHQRFRRKNRIPGGNNGSISPDIFPLCSMWKKAEPSCPAFVWIQRALQGCRETSGSLAITEFTANKSR